MLSEDLAVPGLMLLLFIIMNIPGKQTGGRPLHIRPGHLMRVLVLL